MTAEAYAPPLLILLIKTFLILLLVTSFTKFSLLLIGSPWLARGNICPFYILLTAMTESIAPLAILVYPSCPLNPVMGVDEPNVSSRA